MPHPAQIPVPLPSVIKTIEERSTLRIVRLTGPFDVTKGGEFKQWVLKFRSQKGFEYKHLLVDFADVPDLDSSAVATALKTMIDYKKANQKMGLINLRAESRNRKMFEVFQADKVIHLYETEAEAIQDLK